MEERPLRLATAGLALLMAVVLVLLQFVLTPETKAPTGLFLGFTGVWVFGAVMLVTFPTFGAAGTALYGILVAVGFYQMHGLRSGEDAVMILGSLAATALSIAVLARRFRRGGAVAGEKD